MANDKPASGMVEIGDVVFEHLGNISSGDERREQFLGYALDFYSEELNNHGFIGIKDKVIDLTAWKTFKLPEDCIDWITIAVQVGIRRRSLVRDDSISWNFKDLHTQGLLDVIVKEDQDKMKVYTVNTNSQGDDVGQNFHLTEKHDVIGYFTENKDLKEITIHPVNVTVRQVVLRYISDCYNRREKTLVPVNAKKAMKSYIDWKDHEFGNDKKYSKAERKRGLFTIAYDEFLAMKADWDFEDIREILYDSYSLTPNIS